MRKITIVVLTVVLGGALGACGGAEGTDSTPRAPIEQTAEPGHVTPEMPCRSGTLCAR